MKADVSVIGLGKLGQCLAISLIHKKFKVIGVDNNLKVINSLGNGKVTVDEPKVQKALKENFKNIIFTEDIGFAVRNSNITIIIVGTPSDTYGKFSNKYVKSCLKDISKTIVDKKQIHHIVISSTVMPNSIDKIFIPYIENNFNLKKHEHYSISYCPELVALGSVFNDFLNPGMIIMGCSNEKASKKIRKIYNKWTDNSPEILEMNILNAEITKVAFNVYLTSKITFANNLYNIVNKLDGANIDTITNSLGMDYRISRYFMKGGLSFGGTCFPRDIKAYEYLNKKYIKDTTYTDTIVKINNRQDKLLYNVVIKNVNKFSTISILGLSFKPNTNVVDESPSIKLLASLIKLKNKINVFDSKAISNTKIIFGNKINYFEKLDLAIKDANLIVLLNPIGNFKNILNKTKRKIKLIDPWRLIDKSKLAKNIEYIHYK
ncbi:MAG: hypothetical protein CMM02_06335 [Rhodopirellula sp.]|nr:hypothetical protein [Rhodopirellula sp.]|tara:strand:- start:1129 stop:2427 length:1299 start_codon:yes stop_codon:yes gene_type:complete